MEYASRWARFFAAVIDFVVLIIVWAILGAIGVLSAGGDTIDSTEALSALSPNVLVFVATGALYYIALTIAFGATLGKMALGMRVVGADGGNAGAVAIVVREVIARSGNYIAQIVALVILRAVMDDGDLAGFLTGLVGLLVLLIIFIRILVDDHRQGWHDKIGGTFVVKAR